MKYMHILFLIISFTGYSQKFNTINYDDVKITEIDSLTNLFSLNGKKLDGKFKINYDDEYHFNKNFDIIEFKDGLKDGSHKHYYRKKLSENKLYSKGKLLSTYELKYFHSKKPEVISDSIFYSNDFKHHCFFDKKENLTTSIKENYKTKKGIKTWYYKSGVVAKVDYYKDINFYSRDSSIHYYKNKGILKKVFYKYNGRKSLENWVDKTGNIWLKLIYNGGSIKHGEIKEKNSFHTFKIHENYNFIPSLNIENNNSEILDGLFLNTNVYETEYDLKLIDDTFNRNFIFKTYRDNKLDEKTYIYNAFGETILETNYKNGKLNGNYICYKNLKPIYKAIYKSDLLTSEGEFYLENLNLTKYLDNKSGVTIKNNKYYFKNKPLNGNYIIKINHEKDLLNDKLFNYLLYNEFNVNHDLKNLINNFSIEAPKNYFIKTTFKNGLKVGKEKLFIDFPLVQLYLNSTFFNHEIFNEIGEQVYLNGSKNGLTVINFEGDKFEIPYTNGKINGIVKIYSFNPSFDEGNNSDQLTDEVSFKNGKLNGIHKTFGYKNKIKKQSIYKNDLLHGLTIEYQFNNYKQNYEFFKKINYENNLKHGLYEEYDYNGNLELKCNYKRGKLHGNYEEYENNKTTYKVNYNNGIIKN